MRQKAGVFIFSSLLFFIVFVEDAFVLTSHSLLSLFSPLYAIYRSNSLGWGETHAQFGNVIKQNTKLSEAQRIQRCQKLCQRGSLPAPLHNWARFPPLRVFSWYYIQKIKKLLKASGNGPACQGRAPFKVKA